MSHINLTTNCSHVFLRICIITTIVCASVVYIYLYDIEPGHSTASCHIQWSSCYSENVNSTQGRCKLIKQGTAM